MESSVDPALQGSGAEEPSAEQSAADPAPAAPAATSPPDSKARTWFRANGADVVNVLCLGVAALLAYGFDLDSVGIGGDAIRKWHFVRQWFYANDFSHAHWDHHMARVGMNVFAFVAQLAFGRGPLVYYVPALSAAVIAVVATYATGKRLSGRFVGAAAALFLIVFKPAHAGATQFLPEVFSAMYATLAAYFFLRYEGAQGKARLRWLSVTAATLFAGYLAKETTVFFMPGFVLAIWLCGGPRRIRDVAILLAVFAAGVALETGAYLAFTDYAHRLAVVNSEHVTDGSADKVTFWELFSRYEKAAPEWKVVFYTYLPATLVVLAFAKTRIAIAIALLGAIYYFLLTFLIRSIDPLVVWQTFQSRYLDCASPFVFLTLALFLRLLAQQAWAGVSLAERPRWARFWRLRHGLVPTACITVSLVAHGKLDVERHPFRVLPHDAAILNDAYRRNLPIVSIRNANGLWAIYSVLLDDTLLAKGDQLPSYDEVKRVWNNQLFIVRDTSVYNVEKLRRLHRRRCVVEVTGRAGYTSISPGSVLPPECDAELAR